MKNSKWLLTCVGGVTIIVLGVALWLRAAYQGDLDSGAFKIVQSASASPTVIAMLAERPGTLWSGNTFFILIGDHLYSSGELRKALYNSEIVFEVGRGGLKLDWDTPDVLKVICVRCEITSNMIQTQRSLYKGVSIKYVGFTQ